MSGLAENPHFLQDPASYFDSPEAVATNDELDTAEKLQILQAWKDDETNLQTAAAENMAGGETDILDQVVQAIVHLREST